MIDKYLYWQQMQKCRHQYGQVESIMAVIRHLKNGAINHDQRKFLHTCIQRKKSREKSRMLNIQFVSKIHGITSGMSSSYVGNKNNLYQHRSGNAWFPS
jgi:hypothetical protein